MDEKKAREILGTSNDEISNIGMYANWFPWENEITLDGEFTAEQLEAFAWWMKNKKKSKPLKTGG